MQKTPKFLITDFQSPDIETERRIIENAGGDLAAFQCKTEGDLIAVAGDADVLLVQWAPITRATALKRSPTIPFFPCLALARQLTRSTGRFERVTGASFRRVPCPLSVSPPLSPSATEKSRALCFTAPGRADSSLLLVIPTFRLTSNFPPM